MPSTLSNLFTSFEIRVENSWQFTNFERTTFGTLKNTKVNGAEMTRMMLAFEGIEEKLKVSTKKFRKSTEKWERVKTQAKLLFKSNNDGYDKLEAWIDIKAKSQFKYPIFYDADLQLKELLDLDMVSDQVTVGDFIDHIGPQKISRIDFLKILRATAIVSSNIIEYSVPLYLIMTILLFPIQEFFTNNDPEIFVASLHSHRQSPPRQNYDSDPNKNLYKRDPAVDNRVSATNSESPLPQEAEVLMIMLKIPFFAHRTWTFTRSIKSKLGRNTSDTKNKMKDFTNQLHTSPHGSLFLFSGKVCKINLLKLPEIRTWLTATYYTSMEVLHGIKISSEKRRTMKTQLSKTFYAAFENLTNWELGIRILRGLFPLRVNNTVFGNLGASQMMKINIPSPLYQNSQSLSSNCIPKPPSSTNQQSSSSGSSYTKFVSPQTGSPTTIDSKNHVRHHMNGNSSFLSFHAAGSSSERALSSHQMVGNNTFDSRNVSDGYPRLSPAPPQFNFPNSRANSMRCEECKKAMEFLSSHSAGCHRSQKVKSDSFPFSPFARSLPARSSSNTVGSNCSSSSNPNSNRSPSNLFTDQPDTKWDRTTSFDLADDFSSHHGFDSTDEFDFSHSDATNGSPPAAMPTDRIPGPSHSAYLGAPHSPPMYLVPRDSNAPRYALVPDGPAPAEVEDHQDVDVNQFSIDGDINYNGNDYYLSF